MVVHDYSEEHLAAVQRSPWLTHISIGSALTDALDSFITDGRMEPQVALKVLATFDRVVAEVLAEKVKARLSFKVLAPGTRWMKDCKKADSMTAGTP
jgi:hypothetical protein